MNTIFANPVMNSAIMKPGILGGNVWRGYKSIDTTTTIVAQSTPATEAVPGYSEADVAYILGQTPKAAVRRSWLRRGLVSGVASLVSSLFIGSCAPMPLHLPQHLGEKPIDTAGSISGRCPKTYDASTRVFCGISKCRTYDPRNVVKTETHGYRLNYRYSSSNNHYMSMKLEALLRAIGSYRLARGLPVHGAGRFPGRLLSDLGSQHERIEHCRAGQKPGLRMVLRLSKKEMENINRK